jgi:hypothetical protein
MWPNLRHYPSICMEGMRKTTITLGQDYRPPGRDSNPGPPKYEPEVLALSRRLIFIARCMHSKRI